MASAVANAWAEELVMIGYLLTRLRHLGWAENRAPGVRFGRVPITGEMRLTAPCPGPQSH